MTRAIIVLTVFGMAVMSMSGLTLWLNTIVWAAVLNFNWGQ